LQKNAFWVKLNKYEVPGNTLITVFKMGGKSSKNESGIDIVCDDHQNSVDTLLCTLSLLNGTTSWILEFRLQYKYWHHLAVTWNPHRGLKMYKNGGSMSDLGAVVEVTQISQIVANITNMPYENICLGWCGQNDDGVKVTLDNLYLSEIDLDQLQVRKLYGRYLK